ncbi:hypothetical protein PsYK624_089050 [Phanerochaete sordida]|uniref:Uncharacterized protein n=1 Tax=Phanerochaete sordida TaxID=48140 RepID=A0A9P3GFG6_9APHY|nr:hypothetical protein PsYK624_089050 [Phanerochaete sordida]
MLSLRRVSCADKRPAQGSSRHLRTWNAVKGGCIRTACLCRLERPLFRDTVWRRLMSAAVDRGPCRLGTLSHRLGRMQMRRSSRRAVRAACG